MRRVLAALVLSLVSLTALAQSADQEILSAVDSPDPVIPGNNITYAISIRNNGPNPAVNGGMNANLGGSLTYVSATGPVGFTCANFGAAISCTNPAFPSGTTANFTVVATVGVHLLNFPDGSVSSIFGTSGVTPDPVPGNNATVSVTTSYNSPQIDLQTTVTDSPDPVGPDGSVTFTAQVTNAGPDTATSVNFNVVNNGSLRFQSSTVPAGWNCTLPSVGSTPIFTCTRASFPPGSSTFTVVLLADDQFLGVNDTTVTTNFSANGTGDDTDDNNNGETESTAYVTLDANVAITATDSPDPVTNGNNVTFQVTATNAGPDAGTNTQVTFSPSPSLTFQSIAAPVGWNCTTPAVNAAGVTTCTLASFPNGGSASFTLVTKVVTAGSGGTLTSTFQVGTSIQDPVLTNNSMQVFTNWVGQTTDLSISKNTLSTAAAQGDPITYTISTTNNGPDAASNVTVTDILQPALRFQSISAPAGWSCTTPAVGANGTITCSTASLANGATATFTLVTTVSPNATGTISNSAAVGSGGTDPNAGNSSGASGSVVIAGDADLGITKSTTATSTAPGSSITYTINVTNAGPDPAASAVMNDVLPASLLFQSIAAPAGWSCTVPAVGANGTVTCNAATLASGATATFTLVTTVAPNATGAITNTATAGHSGTDSNSGNSSGSSAPTPVVVPGADLTITKTTASTTAGTGSNVTYTITVDNDGPSTATNVIVTDDLPAGLAFVSATPSQGTCNATDPISCNLGTLANGATAMVSVVATVTATAGTIANTASVDGTEADPAGGNNSSTTPAIPVVPGASQAEAIPTLSEWALIGLALLLGLAAAMRMKM